MFYAVHSYIVNYVAPHYLQGVNMHTCKTHIVGTEKRKTHIIAGVLTILGCISGVYGATAVGNGGSASAATAVGSGGSTPGARVASKTSAEGGSASGATTEGGGEAGTGNATAVGNGGSASGATTEGSGAAGTGNATAGGNVGGAAGTGNATAGGNVGGASAATAGGNVGGASTGSVGSNGAGSDLGYIASIPLTRGASTISVESVDSSSAVSDLVGKLIESKNNLLIDNVKTEKITDSTFEIKITEEMLDWNVFRLWFAVNMSLFPEGEVKPIQFDSNIGEPSTKILRECGIAANSTINVSIATSIPTQNEQEFMKLVTEMQDPGNAGRSIVIPDCMNWLGSTQSDEDFLRDNKNLNTIAIPVFKFDTKESASIPIGHFFTEQLLRWIKKSTYYTTNWSSSNIFQNLKPLTPWFIPLDQEGISHSERPISAMHIIDLASVPESVSKGYVNTIQAVNKLSSYQTIQGVDLEGVQNQIARIAAILKRIGLKGPYDVNFSAAAKKYSIRDPDTQKKIKGDFSQQFKVCGLSKVGTQVESEPGSTFGTIVSDKPYDAYLIFSTETNQCLVVTRDTVSSSSA